MPWPWPVYVSVSVRMHMTSRNCIAINTPTNRNHPIVSLHATAHMFGCKLHNRQRMRTVRTFPYRNAPDQTPEESRICEPWEIRTQTDRTNVGRDVVVTGTSTSTSTVYPYHIHRKQSGGRHAPSKQYQNSTNMILAVYARTLNTHTE